MSRFLIGQVCNALGVRAHVLRYWERHVELLSPAKDLSGRRMYTLRDVQLLFRLKYLVYTRGMSVEGASRKLVEEVQGGSQNRKAALDSLRGDLFRVSLGAQRLSEHLEALAGRPSDAGSVDTPRTARADAVGAELREMVLDAWRRSVAPSGEAAREGAAIRRVRREAAAGSAAAAGTAPADPTAPAAGTEDDFAAARSLLHRAPLLVVSPAPAFGDTVQRYPGLLPLLGRGGETVLDRIGRRLSELAREFGHEPLWLIGASGPVVDAVRRHIARRGSYGLFAERIKVYVEPRVPYLSADGHPLTGADGSQPAYELPLLSALRNAARHAESTGELALIVPVTNALPWIPDLEFISRHLGSGAEGSVKAARVSGADVPAAPTGEALLSTGVGPPGSKPLTATERLRDAIELHRVDHTDIRVARDPAGKVRRFGGEDDILEGEATRGGFGMEQLLEAAGTGLVFEIDAGAEVAPLRSRADWDACSQRVREQS